MTEFENLKNGGKINILKEKIILWAQKVLIY
jgi:hypothetical protein